MEKIFVLDIIDQKILKLLQQDAKMPVRDMAKAVNLSPTPVHNRIKKLEEAGVIDKYIAIINEEKLGNELIALCYLALQKHSTTAGKKFINAVTSWDEVTECYNISGEYDFLMRVVVKNMKEYQSFYVKKIGELENISRSHTVFVMGKLK
jgi:DNA-binding Lrp family transcriptional regulator